MVVSCSLSFKHGSVAIIFQLSQRYHILYLNIFLLGKLHMPSEDKAATTETMLQVTAQHSSEIMNIIDTEEKMNENVTVPPHFNTENPSNETITSNEPAENKHPETKQLVNELEINSVIHNKYNKCIHTTV